MSFKIIKSGIADSIQDAGRFGYQHLGINPGGAMDQVAMKIANALVGNELTEAVFECCFPASTIVFGAKAIIGLSGADFTASLNGRLLTTNRALVVNDGDELKFQKIKKGSFAYLAVLGGFDIPDWLGSKSTNVKLKAGGYQGRYLKKQDEIGFKQTLSATSESKVFPWRVNVYDFYRNENTIRCITGAEWEWLNKKSKEEFQKRKFSISTKSDRMGYRLNGPILKRINTSELISSAVLFGTIQLLPDGQLIILMADHQTTGGYPRVGQIISADLPTLAQMKNSDDIFFRLCTLEEAEEALRMQIKLIRQIKSSCTLVLREYL
jgi:antagonist of KipI